MAEKDKLDQIIAQNAEILERLDRIEEQNEELRETISDSTSRGSGFSIFRPDDEED